MIAMMNKTGEAFYRDEEGRLWKAESFANPETGEVETRDTLVEEDLPLQKE